MTRAVSPSFPAAMAGLLLAWGGTFACDLPPPTSDGWRCTGEGDCAPAWRCVDGLCQRATPAASSGWAASSSASADSTGGTSSGPDPSSARSPAPTVVVFTAGGGHGETAAFRVDWCLGETLAAVPAAGGEVAWGLLSTATVPGGR